MAMQEETGEKDSNERSFINTRRSWFDSKYLKKRMRQLDWLVQDLDPCNPVTLHHCLLRILKIEFKLGFINLP